MSPKKTSVNRISSLDGLRAISIALVFLGHVGGTRGLPRVDLGIGDYAHLGVTVFFVISGFLITRLLLSELHRNGHVSLKLFYTRRSLRLFPASYFYIIVISCLGLAGVVHLQSRDFWCALTYTVNYLPSRSWYVGHLWSLSVEEQFYLLWPLIFVKVGPQRASWFAGGAILLGPIARFAAWFFLKGSPYRDLEMFPMVADSLAIGCLLAKLSGWLEGQGWYLQLFRPVYSSGLLVLMLLINRYTDYTLVAVFGTSIVNLVLAILIHRCVYFSCDGWIGQFLNWKPIALVGVLSYSLYLWQQPFLNRNSNSWVNTFPQNLVFAITAGLASYILIEKPLMSLRHRLRP